MGDDASLLLDFVRSRSHAAFAELVARHVDAVYSAASRRVGGDQHLAEDVTQQVFVALARRAPTLVQHPSLSAWLYVCTRHEAANTVRQERRRKAREQEAYAMQESHQEPDAGADWNRLAPVIDRAIDQLNERDRAAVLLRFFENKTFSEIGARFEVSEDAARMRLDRALEKLRALLGRHGVVSTSAALSLALTQHAVSAAPAALATSTANFALAAGGTTAAAAPGFLKLMASSKLLSGAAGLALLLAAAGTATFEIRRSQIAAAELSAAREINSTLSAQRRDVETQSTALEHEIAHLKKERANAEAVALGATALVAQTSSTAAAPPPKDPVTAGKAFMERHPAVRRALYDWIDAQTNFNWSRFYESAGLTQAEIEAFQKLHRNNMGFNRTVESTGQEIALRPETSIPYEAYTDQLRALLGPERYQQYRDFSAAIPARQLAAELASALAFTTDPLSAAQFDGFTASTTEGKLAHYGKTGVEYDWAAIMTNAERLLSPSQRAVLKGLRAQGEFQQEYSRNWFAAMSSAAAVKPVPSAP